MGANLPPNPERKLLELLPIWHKVTKSEVKSASPSLADKVALNTTLYSIEEIAQKLKELLTNK
jgi:hypothetical protein